MAKWYLCFKIFAWSPILISCTETHKNTYFCTFVYKYYQSTELPVTKKSGLGNCASQWPLCFLCNTFCMFIVTSFCQQIGVCVCLEVVGRGGWYMTLQRVISLGSHILLSSTLGLISDKLYGCSVNQEVGDCSCWHHPLLQRHLKQGLRQVGHQITLLLL